MNALVPLQLRSCLLTVVLFAISGSLVSGAQPRAIPGPQTIEIINASTQTPLQGVTVRLGARYAVTNAQGSLTLEGVPSGNHVLRIEHPQFDLFEQTFSLAAGERSDLRVELQPALFVNLAGRVVLEESGKPVAGAVIRLVPIEVATPYQGEWEFRTSLDGTFQLQQFPSGRYQVTIQAPGCEAFLTEWNSPEETTTNLEWTLRPVTSEVRLRVLVRNVETGAPLAGAWVWLADTWPGGRHGFAISDSNGVANFTGLRAGRYNLETPATTDPVEGIWMTSRGYLELRREGNEVEGRFTQFGGRLSGRLAEDGRTLEGTWRDGPIGNDGSREGGFRLTLATDGRNLGGSWDRGEAGGGGSWSGSRVYGGATSMLPVEAGLFLQAPGYAPTRLPVRLGTVETVEAPLSPLRNIPERETNNSAAAAQMLQPGDTVRLSIFPADDEDWYRFRLPSPASVSIFLGPAIPVAAQMELLSSEGEAIASTWNYARHQVEIRDRWLPAGHYLIRIQGRGQTSEEMTELRFHAEFVQDRQESNGTMAQARLLVAGSETGGWIETPGDIDWYRFELRRPGQIRLHIPPSALRINAELLDREGTSLASSWNYAGHQVRIDRMLAPGRYHVRISSTANAASLEPYRLLFQVVEDDGVDDTDHPATLPVTPRRLIPGSMAASTLFPGGDIDYFMVPVPGPGRIHIHGLADIRHAWTLLNERGETLASSWNYGNHWVRFAANTEAAQTWFLKVNSPGQTASTNPYQVTAHWEPADEYDLLLRHTELSRSVPIDFSGPVRGSIFPQGDVDWFSLEVDHPGQLRLEATGVTRKNLHLFTSTEEELGSSWNYGGHPVILERHVQPGPHYIRVTGPGAAFSGQYALRARLLRAETVEQVPLPGDPVRTLREGEAQTWRVDAPGDRDHFQFSVTGEGTYYLRVVAPVTHELILRNALTNETLQTSWQYGNHVIRLPIQATGPTRYLLEVGGRGSVWSPLPGFVSFSKEDTIPAGRIVQPVIDPLDPTLVRFSVNDLTGTESPVRIEIDPTGSGDFVASLPLQGEGQWRFPGEGLYRARARFHHAGGGTTLHSFWVEAIGYRERSGVVVMADFPSEGQIVHEPGPAVARALSYSGAPITRVEVTLNGRTLPPVYRPPFEFELPWESMTDRDQVLRLTAIDATGERASVERRFQVSEYLGLTPQDRAIMTGNHVRVSWQAATAVQPSVRYRQAGAGSWQVVRGERGRAAAVWLRDLIPGEAYEFQPMGGNQAGPVRTVTRVAGLAFSQPVYGPTIERDYDQRFPIAVRNHAEEPMDVLLFNGEPGTDEILVGFVEEGATSRPFTLTPGEERSFILSLNAQNANREDYSFPVRISSPSGYSDEAEIRVAVRLPRVELVWEDLGPSPRGLGRRLLLRNQGDTLTDLRISADPEVFQTQPAVEHGLLPAGGTLELLVTPRLYDGFQSATSAISAQAVGQSIEHELTLEVPEGQNVYFIMLTPEADAEEIPEIDQELLLARAMSAAYLDPGYITASAWGRGTDTSGNGRADRWTFIDRLERILWVGEDTTGDGAIDFVTADVGFDGQFDYAALREGEEWRPTNLLDVWLEMNFDHPRSRSSYDPYDVEIVMNGTAVATMENTLPEGNFRFRIPPSAVRFDPTGVPSNNTVEVRSRRMNRGSYVMSSNFQIKTRVINTPVWTVAASREEAMAQLRATEGLLLSEPDYSVSSEDLQLLLPGGAVAGAWAQLRIPVHNLGVSPGGEVMVALLRATPQVDDVEIDRQMLRGVPVNGSAEVRFEWPLAPGNQRFKVMVDPDETSADANRLNHQAFLWVDVAGEDDPPRLRVLHPQNGARFTDTVVSLEAEAEDDLAIAAVEVRIDQGTWTPLSWAGGDQFSGEVLLQPGHRQLTFRARDGSGQATESSVRVTVEANVPDFRILHPGRNHNSTSRELEVTVGEATPGTRFVIRTNQRPWQPMDDSATLRRGSVHLSTGSNLIEVKGVSPRGAERIQSVTVVYEPAEEEPSPPAREVNPIEPVEVDGFGPVSLHGEGSRVRPPEPSARRAPPPRMPHPPRPEDLGDFDAEEEDPMPPIPDEVQEALDELEADDDRAQSPGSPARAGRSAAQTEEAEEYDGFPPFEEDASDYPGEADLLAEWPNWAMDFLSAMFAGEETLPPETDTDGLDTAAGTDRPSPGLPPSGLLSPRPVSGRSIGVQRTQQDRHCTNRPNIRMQFTLPDWLRKLDLPKPGSPEYEAMTRKLLQRLRDEGIDTTALERFQEGLRRRARQLDSPEDLPTFLQSLGFTSQPPQDPAGLAAWREAMVTRVDAWWLRLLASGDPQLVYEGLRARADAFGHFDQALQLSADAAMEEIQNNQRMTRDVIGMIPYVSQAMDVLMLYHGEDLAGDELTAGRLATMAGFRALMHLGPRGLAAVHDRIRSTDSGRLFFQAVGEMGSNLNQAGVRNLARALGTSETAVRQKFNMIWQTATRERHLFGNRLNHQAEMASRNFQSSQSGRAASYLQGVERQKAERLLRRLEQASNDPRQFRHLVVELQRNKTAQHLFTTGQYSDALRTQALRSKMAMGRLADQRTAAAIRSLAPDQNGMDRVLRNNPGLRPDQVTIRARTISAPPRPGAPVSFGRDRDVWFEFVDSRTGRRLGDVHHGVSAPIYGGNLKRITGRSAHELDHSVTSWWHPDAYATGRRTADSHGRAALGIASGRRAGQLTRARDVADTTRYKTITERFGEARRSANPIARNQNMREGMRQTLKEYDRHVSHYFRDRGGAQNLPPRLRKGLDIFRQVNEGLETNRMTVEQGVRMLESFGATPETIAEDLSQTILFINLWGG